MTSCGYLRPMLHMPDNSDGNSDDNADGNATNTMMTSSNEALLRQTIKLPKICALRPTMSQSDRHKTTDPPDSPKH